MDPTPPSPPSLPPPGWYPDPQTPGRQRWWDGRQWGVEAPLPAPYPPGAAPGASVADERSLATLAHVLAIFTGFLGPLVIYLIAKPDQPYAKHHAAESLNFQITVFIGVIATILLCFVLIGFLLLPVIAIAPIVFEIIAAVAANRGEWYRYPINLRIASGARD